MALLDTAAKLSAPVPEPMWGQVPNEKFLSLKSAFGLLEPELGDLELKRLLVRRVCRAYRAAEGEVIYRLYTEGILPANVATLWSSLPDIDELVAASRAEADKHAPNPAGPDYGKGNSPDASQFKKQTSFTFEGIQPNGSPDGPTSLRSSGKSSLGSVDYSEGDHKKLLRRLRKTNSSGGKSSRLDDFRKDLELAKAADRRLVKFDVSNRSDFAALAPAHKAEAIRVLAIAAREGALEHVALDGVGLDLSVAEQLAQLLSAPNLKTLSLMNNCFNDAALQRLSRAFFNHPNLEELGFGQQHGIAMSTYAIKGLIDAFETVPTCIKLRLGTIFDDVERRRYIAIETAHIELMRLRRGKGGPKEVRKKVTTEKKKDELGETIWTIEAEKIAKTSETTMGRPRDGATAEEMMAAEEEGRPQPKLKWRDPQTHYILTGSPEWRSATKAERRVVIEAFATNKKMTTVSMSDSDIDDDLARSWATVLAQPTCIIESLTLESNPLSSAGIEAIASALPSNQSLTELRLRNLHGRVSKHAEEVLGAALEKNTRITMLYIDLKSFKAQDLFVRYLTRNEMARREKRGWGAELSRRATPGGLWDPNWKSQRGEKGHIGGARVINTGLGKHVSQARELWESFVTGRKKTPRTAGADGWAAARAGLASRAIFEPEELAKVDLDAKQAALPFVSFSDVTMDAARKAAAMRAGLLGRKEEEEEDKKKSSTAANPMAEAVAETAETKHDEVVKGVEALEEKRLQNEADWKQQHEWHHQLSWMLEHSGEVLPSARYQA